MQKLRVYIKKNNYYRYHDVMKQNRHQRTMTLTLNSLKKREEAITKLINAEESRQKRLKSIISVSSTQSQPTQSQSMSLSSTTPKRRRPSTPKPKRSYNPHNNFNNNSRRRKSCSCSCSSSTTNTFYIHSSNPSNGHHNKCNSSDCSCDIKQPRASIVEKTLYSFSESSESDISKSNTKQPP
eukprot:147789_1